MERSAGILLPITSLPSPYGIGTFGKKAYEFIDFLHDAGQTWWQLLPLGHTGFGDSPYQTFSTCAGNPYFVDLEMLAEDGLLSREELDSINWGTNPSYVDYGKVYESRYRILRKAYEAGWERDLLSVADFGEENVGWLRDYALYMALKDHFDGKPWYEWPEEIRNAHGTEDGREVMDRYSDELREEVNFYIYIQYLFFKQWEELHDYAREKGISFMGDVPIYVPIDSVDIWANPQLFQLDEDLVPTKVAGVPPDYFSEDGQLWGNPLYDWDVMKEDGYRWWMERLENAQKMFEAVRIDHFRGLASYWAVPYGEETARNGEWIPGPGKDFIDAIEASGFDAQLIAEDLGILTEDVFELMEYAGYPGMKILEFSFDSPEPNNYRPYKYEHNCVCYAGTHDNATVRQWFEGLNPYARDFAVRYMALSEQEGYTQGVLRTGMSSVADLFIAQIQDWLDLGKEARMNAPGVLGAGNWEWRLTDGMISSTLAEKIRECTERYERQRIDNIEDDTGSGGDHNEGSEDPGDREE